MISAQFTDKVLDNMDRNTRQDHWAFLDITKAFDTVSHDILYIRKQLTGRYDITLVF